MLSSSIVFLLRMGMCFREDLSELIRSSLMLLLELNGMFYIDYKKSLDKL